MKQIVLHSDCNYFCFCLPSKKYSFHYFKMKNEKEKAFFIKRNNTMGEGLKINKCFILKLPHRQHVQTLLLCRRWLFDLRNVTELVTGFLPERPPQTITFCSPQCGKHQTRYYSQSLRNDHLSQITQK